MADLSILAGATSQSILVDLYILTTGAPQTALVYNSTGLIAYYSFTGTHTTATAITLATLAGVTSAYSSGGFIKIDDTNMAGLYRLDLPDAALAASKGRQVVVTISGFSGMATRHIKIELTGWDNQDAVHGGMSALPNTACTSNASLITSGTGTAQLSVTSGIAQANVEQWDSVAIAEPTTDGVPDVNVLNWNGTVVATPATAGIPDVNAKNWNNLATVALPLAPATAGRTLVVDAAGLADANMVKMGPTGAGTAQTARDIGSSVLLSSGTGTGQVKLSSGYVAPNWGDVGNPTTTVGLTGTTIATSQIVASVSGAVGSVTGNVGGSVASVTAAVTLSAGDSPVQLRRAGRPQSRSPRLWARIRFRWGARSRSRPGPGRTNAGSSRGTSIPQRL
jgi:hypothetical protein